MVLKCVVVITQSIELEDGRVLSYGIHGDPAGESILFFHGTPGSRIEGELLHDAALVAGVRIIAPDRPGMGRSTMQTGRTLLDWASDVEELADAVELDRLRIIGYSGGGPYALVCAARLASRIDAVSVVSGCAPVDRPGVMVGSSSLDRVLVGLSVHFLPVATWILAAMAMGARVVPRIGLTIAHAEMTDRERRAMGSMLTRSAARNMADFTESTRSGARGAALDYRVTSRPWGFVPEEVAVPVTFWHGELDDVVPLHQVQGLVARTPRARLVTVPASSHLAIRVAATEIIAELLAQRPPFS